MLVAQFDALLAILEPHIKKKTTNFHELSVQRPIECFVLQDEVDQLVRRHSGFWCSFVRWLWIFKTPLKMLAMEAKNAENQTRSQLFYDGRKFWRQCVNVHWHSVRSYLFFNLRKFRTLCARTLSLQNVRSSVWGTDWNLSCYSWMNCSSLMWLILTGEEDDQHSDFSLVLTQLII